MSQVLAKRQFHSILGDVITASSIAFSLAERSREELLDLYEQIQQILFPHL